MVYGVGYCSEKECSYSNWKDKCFLTWRNMLKRCYSNEKKYKNYRDHGASVCDEWLDFSVFKKWFNRNYYQIDGEEIQLDKDILKHGNQIYCPEYCIFVPRKINSLFVRSDNKRGELPIGVIRHEKQYRSCCSVGGISITRDHKDPISAFYEYKRVKEQYVKNVALEYKDKIPERLYNAMMMFEVRIDD